MSYDIHLLVLKPGESAREAAYRDQVEDEPYTAEAKARNDRVVAALLAQYPGFGKFESDCVELTDMAGGTGMQVSLFASSGAISLPYWHGENAEAILEKVNGVLRTILANSDFVAFDPQLDQELNGQTGITDAAAPTYAMGVKAVQDTSKKPWWRFW